MDRECICIPLFTQMADISNIYWQQLDKLLAKILVIWTKKCYVCVISNKKSYCIKQNCNILFVLFTPGSAETDVWWGENINGYLMASCVWNTRTKNYLNVIIYVQVIIDKFWCFYASQTHSVVTSFWPRIPKIRVLVLFLQSLVAPHISRVNCAKMAGDRSGQPAYEFCLAQNAHL